MGKQDGSMVSLLASGSRVGVINVWTQKDLFHDVVTVILMTRMGVRELDDDDEELTLVTLFD